MFVENKFRFDRKKLLFPCFRRKQPLHDEKLRRFILFPDSMKAKPRIVGGAPADQKHSRWTVFLKCASSQCGGSIISSRHILTAAHCVFGLNASDITVYAGSIRSQHGSQDRSVSAITIHPNYDNDTHLNDIAILHLSERLNMTDPAVSFISLPSFGSKEYLADHWPATGAEVSELDMR